MNSSKNLNWGITDCLKKYPYNCYLLSNCFRKIDAVPKYFQTEFVNMEPFNQLQLFKIVNKILSQFKRYL